MALALLAGDWARARGGEAVALVVDHGLRAESAEEARTVRGWLKARGLAVVPLLRTGPRPRSGLQAAARTARHRLLANACRERKILHLLIAHHRRDQAETVAMRRERGSAAAGLAGMAVVREIAGLRLLRPLLDLPPARLRATLVARGQSWIEDPSNRDPAFRRAALRAAGGLDVDRLAAEAAAFGDERRAAGCAYASLLARTARPHPAGFVSLARAELGRASAHMRVAVLARTLACVAGAPYLPRSRGLVRLCARLETDQAGVTTLGGCLLRFDRDRILVTREPAAVRDVVTLVPFEPVRFDRRFVVRLTEDRDGALLCALGIAGWRRLDASARRRFSGIPHAARLGLPALFTRGSRDELQGPWHVHDGALSHPTQRPLLEVSFRPALPLADAPFGGEIVVSSPAWPILG